jgi:hypothetical protein
LLAKKKDERVKLSTIDATEAWRIMPFARPSGEEWWILSGLDCKVLEGGLTKLQAFDKALAHNKAMNIPAVYVHGTCMKGGGWKKELTKPQ